MYMYGCPPETITTLLIGYTPIQNKKFTLKKKKRKKSSCLKKNTLEKNGENVLGWFLTANASEP